MKIPQPCLFATLKMLSIFSIVLFSSRLSRTNGHASPVSLSTSFCGSMNTTAVSPGLICIVPPPDLNIGRGDAQTLGRNSQVPRFYYLDPTRQRGLAVSQEVAAGSASVNWTITGVRAHEIETDHTGSFFTVSASITVNRD